MELKKEKIIKKINNMVKFITLETVEFKEVIINVEQISTIVSMGETRTRIYTRNSTNYLETFMHIDDFKKILHTSYFDKKDKEWYDSFGDRRI